ncbi:MAG: hypothetical protein ACOVQT_11275 [Rubrivivax sp.]|jgi:hypothetical protein
MNTLHGMGRPWVRPQQGWRPGRLAPGLLARAALATLSLTLCTTAPARESPDDALAQGLAAYDRNEWPQAWARLSALADSGHPRAAWLAGMMWRLGPSLYGQHWAASAERLERWAAFSACGGHCAAEPVGPGGC